MSFVSPDINQFLYLRTPEGQKLKEILESKSYLYDDTLYYLPVTENYLNFFENKGISAGQALRIEHEFYSNGADPVFVFENRFKDFEIIAQKINEDLFSGIGKVASAVWGFVKGAYFEDQNWMLGALHLILDIVSLIPATYIGIPIDRAAALVNGIIYLIQGRFFDAAISFIALLPFGVMAEAFRPLARFTGIKALSEAIFKTDKGAAAHAVADLYKNPEFLKVGGGKFINIIKEFLRGGVEIIYKMFDGVISGIAKVVGWISTKAETKILGLKNTPTLQKMKALSASGDDFVREIEAVERGAAGSKTVTVPKPGMSGTQKLVPHSQDLMITTHLDDFMKTAEYAKLPQRAKEAYKYSHGVLQSFKRAGELVEKSAIHGTKEAEVFATALSKYTNFKPSFKLLMKDASALELRNATLKMLDNPAFVKGLSKGDLVFLKTIAAKPNMYMNMLKTVDKNKALISGLIKNGVASTTFPYFKYFFRLVLRNVATRSNSLLCQFRCWSESINDADGHEVEVQTVEQIKADLMKNYAGDVNDPTVQASFTQAAMEIHSSLSKYTAKPNCNENCEPLIAAASTYMPVHDPAYKDIKDVRYKDNDLGQKPIYKKEDAEAIARNQNEMLKNLGMAPVEDVMFDTYDSIPDSNKQLHFLTIISIQNGTAYLDDSQAMTVAKQNIDWLLNNKKITKEDADMLLEETKRLVDLRIQQKQTSGTN